MLCVKQGGWCHRARFWEQGSGVCVQVIDDVQPRRRSRLRVFLLHRPPWPPSLTKVEVCARPGLVPCESALSGNQVVQWTPHADLLHPIPKRDSLRVSWPDVNRPAEYGGLACKDDVRFA